MEKMFYSAEELGEMLGLSLPRVYALMKTSGFPAVRVSARRFVIPADCLQKWFAEQAAKGIGG